jgi:ABC-2 type transport system ATP-binding protein
MSDRSPTIVEGLDEPAHSLREAARPRGPVVIEARGIYKTFRIPDHKVETLKERAVHPFTRVEHRELHALRDVSFDIHKGEFFGIVGRNGSGKSTLLKIMASIYRADRGRVRMAGRVAPFIELGVGVNPDLTARENAVLNGVMMGLTRKEAQRRLDAVIEFAELEEFADLKLKNYSSGMMVRFAFAVMVQADADVMLIDEVLAVGDASFAQKCMDVFHERKAAGKTIVLVTHDMATVQAMCHRAMLIEEGEVKYVGDPDSTALEYYRLNFAGPKKDTMIDDREPMVDFNAKAISATLRDPSGEAVENVEQGTPIAIDIVLEAARPLEGPTFAFHVRNDDGMVVFAFNTSLDDRVPAGARMRLQGSIDNRLVPGRYHLDCWVRQYESEKLVAVQGLRLLAFVVYGTSARDGVVTVDASVEASVEGGP